MRVLTSFTTENSAVQHARAIAIRNPDAVVQVRRENATCYAVWYGADADATAESPVIVTYGDYRPSPKSMSSFWRQVDLGRAARRDRIAGN